MNFYAKKTMARHIRVWNLVSADFFFERYSFDEMCQGQRHVCDRCYLVSVGSREEVKNSLFLYYRTLFRQITMILLCCFRNKNFTLDILILIVKLSLQGEYRYCVQGAERRHSWCCNYHLHRTKSFLYRVSNFHIHTSLKEVF